MKRRLVLIVTCVALLAIAGGVLAKQEPYVEAPGEDFGGVDAPFTIPDGLDAFILAGRFDTDTDVDAFTHTVSFDAAASVGIVTSVLPTPTPLPTSEGVMALPIEVIVPVCGEHFEPVYPSVAIIGQGLDAPEEELPFDLPDGMGALILAREPLQGERAPRSNWADVITYAPESFSVELPEGAYTLAIWEPNGNPGAYLLSVAGNVHSVDDARDRRERDAAFDLLSQGNWMDADCDAAEFAFNTPLADEEA